MRYVPHAATSEKFEKPDPFPWMRFGITERGRLPGARLTKHAAARNVRFLHGMRSAA
jgi:hypothetical protein